MGDVIAQGLEDHAGVGLVPEPFWEGATLWTTVPASVNVVLLYIRSAYIVRIKCRLQSAYSSVCIMYDLLLCILLMQHVGAVHSWLAGGTENPLVRTKPKEYMHPLNALFSCTTLPPALAV